VALADEPGPRTNRGMRRVALSVGLPLAALGSVLLALASGAPPGRWWPVAAFLGVTLSASLYYWAFLRMSFRRSQRLRQIEVSWDVRLTKPLWISLMMAFLPLGAGALLGAVAATLTFPGVGLGALLTFIVVGLGVSFAELGMSPRGLTFEHGGLRVHFRGATFLVPWTTIARVEQIGPDHSQMIRLRVTDTAVVVESAEPNSPLGRSRVERIVKEGSGPEGQIIFTPWTAGLDGPTLARTIRAAVSGQIGRVN
jgi:hypothetical protein